MSLRISIPFIAQTESISIRTIDGQGQGRCRVGIEEPKNCHDLQVFLGMMVYFSVYIPFYAWIAGPLFGLLKKSANWEWTEVHSEAFELCKQVLVNAPVRGYVKPGSPYQL